MPLPVGIARPAPDFVMEMTLSESSVLPASCRESSEFTMLVDSLAEPVYSGVTTDDLVLWVHHDDFIELVDRVLTHPVGV